jgi:hypothetical protein
VENNITTCGYSASISQAVVGNDSVYITSCVEEERDEVKGRCRSVESAERCLCSLPDVVVWQRDATSALKDEDRNPTSRRAKTPPPLAAAAQRPRSMGGPGRLRLDGAQESSRHGNSLRGSRIYSGFTNSSSKW